MKYSIIIFLFLFSFCTAKSEDIHIPFTVEYCSVDSIVVPSDFNPQFLHVYDDNSAVMLSTSAENKFMRAENLYSSWEMYFIDTARLTDMHFPEYFYSPVVKDNKNIVFGKTEEFSINTHNPFENTFDTLKLGNIDSLDRYRKITKISKNNDILLGKSIIDIDYEFDIDSSVLMLSKDNGATWERIDTTLKRISGWPEMTFYNISISKKCILNVNAMGMKKENDIYSEEFLFFFSADNGKTWKFREYEKIEKFRRPFAYMLNENDGIMIRSKKKDWYDDPLSHNCYMKVYNTQDAGKNWNMVISDTNSRDISQIEINEIEGEELLVKAGSYLMHSIDKGLSWTYLQREDQNYRLNPNSICLLDNRRFACIVYRPIIYFIDLKTTGIKEISPTNQELMIYPNPVISGQEVNFKLEREILGEINIEIIDINGNTIDKNTLSALPENKACSFDTSELPSGTYFIRIIFGKEIINGKFTIVK